MVGILTLIILVEAVTVTVLAIILAVQTVASCWGLKKGQEKGGQK